MKKLKCFILGLTLTIGFISSGHAQAPTPLKVQTGVVAGGTYTYTVPNPSGITWTWTVMDDKGTVIDGTGGEFVLEDVDPTSPLGYTKNITWKDQGTFYVSVVAENTTTHCTNDYVIQVDVSTNDYEVAYNTTTTKTTYCADDPNIESGLEISLDLTLGSGAAKKKPADVYYDMTVYYKINDGTTKLATLSNTNKFNIDGIPVANAVTPGFTTVKVTIEKIVDSKGVEFSPAADELIITVNPIPATPEITFN